MSSYFSYLPNFDYVSRLPNSKISDYITVKNFFQKGYIRDDIFQDLSHFTKYKIIGDDRPDNVAYRIYGDASLDWVILISNNILNIQTEWPLTQYDFDNNMLEKYGNYENLYSGIHHYETTELRNGDDNIIVPAGLNVDQDFSIEYSLLSDGTIKLSRPVRAVTNYEYEEKIQTERRNIYVLKSVYLSTIIDDIKELMAYEKGSTQYVSRTLKRGDNIKIYS